MKKNVDVMEIIRRVISALLAFAVFPIAYYREFIYTQISTGLIQEAALEWNITIKRIVDILTGRDTLSSVLKIGESGEPFEFPAALEPVKSMMIAFAVTFAVILVIAVFLILWSAISKNRVVPICVSAVGIVGVFVMKFFFDKIAAPLVDGTIGLLSIFSDGFLMSLIGNIVSISLDVLVLGTFKNGLIICLLGVAIWNALFIFVDIGDADAQAKKAERAAKKASKKRKA